MAAEKLGLNKSSLRENEPVKVDLGGKSFVLVLYNGKVHALDELCTHEHGPLADGSMDGKELICPWHSGAFDIETGKASENTPWATDTKHYPITADSTGELFILL